MTAGHLNGAKAKENHLLKIVETFPRPVREIENAWITLSDGSDVVDVPDAAGIGRSHAGRAVVRVGAGLVRVVQTARVGGHAMGDSRPQVRAVPWERAGDSAPRSELAQPGGPSDLARLVDSACRAAERLATGPAPSPWLPPLRDIVTVDDLARLPVPDSAVVYGVADVPDEQRQAAVSFAVDGGDHLLVAGAARSGRSTLLRTLAAGLAARWDVADLHLFALDGGGGALAPLAELPHCGAVVARDEPARGDRLLSRLAGEVESRQRLLAASGYGSVEEQRAGTTGAERLPWLVLLADGWEGLAAAYEAVDHGRPLDTLLRLVREGAAAGVRVVLTGDRAVLTGRAAAAFRDRVVLRLADRADYGLAGISPRQVPGDLPAGRALVGPDALEAQLAVLDPDTSGAGQLRALQEVATRARAAATGAAPWQLPLRVEPLPSRVDVGDVEAAAKAIEPGAGWALVGVGGDELLPVGIDLDLDGPAFVVAGPPGSGRSTALATIGRWALGRGRPVVIVAHRRSPLRALAHDAGAVAALGPGDAFELEQALSGHPEALVVADDAETLHDTAVERPLLGLLRADAEGTASLVLAGSAQEMAGKFRGLTVEARRTRTGLLLGALSPVDGDLLGVRVTSCDAAPPGRGVLVVRGRPTPVQVARSPL
jgi:S-DNA-T family DNA segregation ATPase FtsK/SpoIIIE